MKQICLNILVLWLSVIMIPAALANKAEFKYNSKGNRDPFSTLVTEDGRILPGAKSVSETGNVELGGILWDESGNSLAIINGKPVKEKERVLDMQILKIKKTSVILQKGGKVMVINLKKEGGSTNEE